MDNPEFTIDFETTDKDAKVAKPVEVAYYNGERSVEQFIFQESIPVETSAIHHIIPDDVKNSRPWDTVKHNLAMAFGHQPLTILIAHNAEYEKTVLGDFPPVLWICTYKCALRVWPDAPNHKNETLRYWLGLGKLGRAHNQQTHSALHDAKVTWLIYQELKKHATVEQMIAWTELPAKLPRMPMGKHFGAPWSEVPSGYLVWVTQQADMREDVKFCAKEELERRRR
jgi:DNA polymerase III, epsilon subunit and related 3''-5'' exonucleases